MAEESEKTITLKKDTLWKVAVVILAIALVASIFTAGFGIVKSSGNVTQNTGTDLSVFTTNANLYPSLGPANAKNTVIEFADFQCPYCAMASGLPSWTSQYASQYGDLVGVAGKLEAAAQSGSIRFIYVPMGFLGNESVYAAEAALCANGQGKFWDMHDAIFKASTAPTEDTGKYSKANLEIIAQGINGLDQAKFKTCLESDTYATSVQEIMQDTQSSGVQIATPQFFVNGKSVTPSWAAIQAALQ